MLPIETARRSPQGGRQSPTTSDLYTTETNPNDVLLGRGVPIFNHSGNVRFRQLVQTRKARYSAARRHQLKDDIAREIIADVENVNGRFLREVKTSAQAAALGIERGTKAWEIVDDAAKMLKVKQALREPLSQDRESIEGSQRSEQQVPTDSIASSVTASNQLPTSSVEDTTLDSSNRLVQSRQSMLQAMLVAQQQQEQEYFFRSQASLPIPNPYQAGSLPRYGSLPRLGSLPSRTGSGLQASSLEMIAPCQPIRNIQSNRSEPITDTSWMRDLDISRNTTETRFDDNLRSQLLFQSILQDAPASANIGLNRSSSLPFASLPGENRNAHQSQENISTRRDRQASLPTQLDQFRGDRRLFHLLPDEMRARQHESPVPRQLAPPWGGRNFESMLNDPRQQSYPDFAIRSSLPQRPDEPLLPYDSHLVALHQPPSATAQHNETMSGRATSERLASFFARRYSDARNQPGIMMAPSVEQDQKEESNSSQQTRKRKARNDGGEEAKIQSQGSRPARKSD